MLNVTKRYDVKNWKNGSKDMKNKKNNRYAKHEERQDVKNWKSGRQWMRTLRAREITWRMRDTTETRKRKVEMMWRIERRRKDKTWRIGRTEGNEQNIKSNIIWWMRETTDTQKREAEMMWRIGRREDKTWRIKTIKIKGRLREPHVWWQGKEEQYTKHEDHDISQWQEFDASRQDLHATKIYS